MAIVITATPLPVITDQFCKGFVPFLGRRDEFSMITDCNYRSDHVIPLQSGPVITVTGGSLSESEITGVSENRSELPTVKSNYVTPVLNRAAQTSKNSAARNYPTCCPWLGHDAICPSFERDRDTFYCCWCNREFTVNP